MNEVLLFLKNKKNLANLIVTGILALSIPIGVTLVRQQQLFATRADGQPEIELVFDGSANSCVIQEGNNKVLICDSVPLKLISPLGPPDPQAGGQASLQNILAGLTNMPKFSYLAKAEDPVIPTPPPSAIGPINVTCSPDKTSARTFTDTVVWNSNVTGGAPPYTYQWVGSDPLNGRTDSSPAVVYSSPNSVTPESKTGTLTVTDFFDQTQTVDCGSVSVSGYDPLTATCAPDRTSSRVGESIAWTAQISGGSGQGQTFQWIGDDSLDGGTSNPANVTYNTVGEKFGSILLFDDVTNPREGNHGVLVNCTSPVVVTANNSCPEGQVNPHSVCQNGSCVQIDSCGATTCTDNNTCQIQTPTPTPTFSPTPTPTPQGCPSGEVSPHTTCQQGSCVEVAGCGVSTCVGIGSACGIHTPTPSPSPTPPPVDLIAPTVNTGDLTCLPSSGYTGSGITISWTNPSGGPAVTFADIGNVGFSPYYHKAVIGSGSNTTAPNGFTLSTGTDQLTLLPDTSYYARVWNGEVNSPSSAMFSFPPCQTETPTPTPSATPTPTPTPGTELNVSCAPDHTSVQINGTVRWTATVSNGSGQYNYLWSGSDSLANKTEPNPQVTYTTVGTKTGSVLVTDRTSGATKQVDCQSSVTVEAAPIYTTHYRLATSEARLVQATYVPYITEPTITNFSLNDNVPGAKQIWVEFKDNQNPPNTARRVLSTQLIERDPVITGLTCRLDISKTEVLIDIAGLRFGPSVGGKATANDTDLSVLNWTVGFVSSKLINPSIPPAEGQQYNVQIIRADGKKSEKVSCRIGISELSLGAKLFCRGRDQNAQQGVSVLLFDDKGTKVEEKVNIDAAGVVTGLKTKLEAGKKYTMSIKPPKGLRRNANFEAIQGTTVIVGADGNPFILPIGDIAPESNNGDGIINVPDYNLLTNQWGNLQDTSSQLSGDFNLDKRVNSFDWACMRYDFGKREDPIPTPRPSVSPSPSPVPTPVPSPV